MIINQKFNLSCIHKFPSLNLKSIFTGARRKGNQDVKGLRKLHNYQNKLAEFNTWKKRASPEDVEYQEIEIGNFVSFYQILYTRFQTEKKILEALADAFSGIPRLGMGMVLI